MKKAVAALLAAAALPLAAAQDPWGCAQVPAAAFTPIALASPSGAGIDLAFVPYGGTAQKLHARGRDGQLRDVLLGFDDASQYCKGTLGDAGHPYFGALIGRVANRITNGHAVIDGRDAYFPINEAPGNDTLHGGTFGFDRKVWAVTLLNKSAALLQYTSPDGEMGFPGTLSVNVTYVIGEDSWTIAYSATALDADTIFAPTQHAYWNLAGSAALVTEHRMAVPDGAYVLDVSPFLLPTGALLSVADAASSFLDFRVEKAVGRDIGAGTLFSWGHGYDHAWIFGNWTSGQAPVERVRVVSPESGIGMAVSTDQPSVQIYSGNFLNGTIPQKSGQDPRAFYEHWGALAIEAQHYPDAPNHASFPPITLYKGQTYAQTTTYRFFVA